MKNKKVRPKKKEEIKEKKKEVEEITNYHFFQVFILIIIVVVLLLLVSNRTFFSNNFTNEEKGKNLKFRIPLFSYLVSDENKVVTLYSLKSKKQLNDYFNKYLESDNFVIYNCQSYSKPLYYKEKDQTFIYDLEIKGILIKTIKFKYATEDYNEICNMFDN